ncbi:MAG TPA: hypothetical protein PLW10_13730 [Myxococcota bacterium]|nr:hypothetical protein [Myxococcota bacterium]
MRNELRIEQKQPSWREWFTWLGDQVALVQTRGAPAHVQHRGWRP